MFIPVRRPIGSNLSLDESVLDVLESLFRDISLEFRIRRKKPIEYFNKCSAVAVFDVIRTELIVPIKSVTSFRCNLPFNCPRFASRDLISWTPPLALPHSPSTNQAS